MQCENCGKEKKEIPIISTRGMEICQMCDDCNKAEMDQLLSRNKMAVLEIMRKGGVPKRFLCCRLSEADFKFRDSDQVANGDKGLFFIGDTGTGKTTRLAGWAAYMVQRGKSIKFIDFSDFICELRADFKRFNDLKNDMMGVDCLFIDNFDANNQYMYDFIFNLVNSLYQREKQVFYTGASLPGQEPLAMRIGKTTIQLELVKGGLHGN